LPLFLFSFLPLFRLPLAVGFVFMFLVLRLVSQQQSDSQNYYFLNVVALPHIVFVFLPLFRLPVGSRFLFFMVFVLLTYKPIFTSITDIFITAKQ